MPVRDKKCPACGSDAPLTASACPRCGRPFAGLEPERAPHDVSVAAMMSIFLPGGGELYNGQVGKAALMALLYIVPVAAAFLTRTWWIGLVAPVVWCVSVTDASITAGRILRGETVGAWKWF